MRKQQDGGSSGRQCCHQPHMKMKTSTIGRGAGAPGPQLQKPMDKNATAQVDGTMNPERPELYEGAVVVGEREADYIARWMWTSARRGWRGRQNYGLFRQLDGSDSSWGHCWYYFCSWVCLFSRVGLCVVMADASHVGQGVLQVS